MDLSKHFWANMEILLGKRIYIFSYKMGLYLKEELIKGKAFQRLHYLLQFGILPGIIWVWKLLQTEFSFFQIIPCGLTGLLPENSQKTTPKML